MWHLVTVNTYGTWLPGDPRGFQTRHHRTHVAPPRRYATDNEVYDPQEFVELHERSETHLNGDEIKLTPAQVRIVVSCFRGHLAEMRFACLAMTMDFWHGHLVVSCAPDDLKTTVAKLKGRASRMLGKQGLPGRVWSKRFHARKLKDENAVRAAVQYVARHANARAVTWINPDAKALIAVEFPKS